MLAYLAYLFVFLFIIGILWIIQPYKNWRKNFDARQYEPITITNRKKITLGIDEYRKK